MADKQLKVFRVDDGETWWIVAFDDSDALEVAKTMDIGIDDDFEELLIEEMPMDEILTVVIDSSDVQDNLHPKEPYHNGDKWHVSATMEEWVSISKRGDLIASTVF